MYSLLNYANVEFLILYFRSPRLSWRVYYFYSKRTILFVRERETLILNYGWEIRSFVCGSRFKVGAKGWELSYMTTKVRKLEHNLEHQDVIIKSQAQEINQLIEEMRKGVVKRERQREEISRMKETSRFIRTQLNEHTTKIQSLARDTLNLCETSGQFWLHLLDEYNIIHSNTCIVLYYYL